MNDYDKEIDFLFDRLKNKVLTEDIVELEKQNFKNLLKQILIAVYQEGLNEGIDRSIF